MYRIIIIILISLSLISCEPSRLETYTTEVVYFDGTVDTITFTADVFEKSTTTLYLKGEGGTSCLAFRHQSYTNSYIRLIACQVRKFNTLDYSVTYIK